MKCLVLLCLILLCFSPNTALAVEEGEEMSNQTQVIDVAFPDTGQPVYIVAPEGKEDAVTLEDLHTQIDDLQLTLNVLTQILDERLPQEQVDYSEDLQGIRDDIQATNEDISNVVLETIPDSAAQIEQDTSVIVYASFALGFTLFSVLGFLFVRLFSSTHSVVVADD